jgi:predicted secreted protein
MPFSYIAHMKWIIVLLLILPLGASAQKKIKLKRKYLAKYEGVIPAYSMGSALEVVDVDEVPITVTIGKGFIYTTIGDRKLQGTYVVMFEAETYYLLDATMQGQMANERILVYKRGKRISRDGMYPQPVADLKKKRRR